MSQAKPLGRYPTALTVEDFQRNFRTVLARIQAACEKAKRSPLEVRLLPVSKTYSESTIRTAYAAGLSWFGENKVQEAQRKSQSLADLADVRWSVIGHLQTNKAKQLARFASEFHGLESLRVAETLERSLNAEKRALDVYVQVNTSEELSKHGIHPSELADFLAELSSFKALRIKGLMTMAMLSSDDKQVRECFALLRRSRDQVRKHVPPNIGLDELSMGMSGDLEIAIEEGSTIVRVGQAIFGARPLNDGTFWPEELPL